MMDPGWSLARVEEARASYFAEYVAIHISGEMPEPCWFVDIERNLLTIEPPEFIARWHRPQGLICPQVMTPYAHQEVFRIGARRETVKLHHADGLLEIPVRVLTQQFEEEDSTTSTALLAQGSPYETVGYSDAFDFAEAFRDAISHLPDQGAGIPDWLSTYVVAEIGAEIGGIAGFNRMYVRVRGEGL